MDSLGEEQKQEFIFSLQSLGQLVWDCCWDMQSEAGFSPLATDKLRDSKYAAVLRKYMNDLSKSTDVFTFPWEWFTLSIMLIWPVYNTCNEHYDGMNCLSYGYSKTGCANFIIKDKSGNIYLLQVLTNFRNSIESDTFPYRRHCETIVANSELYLSQLRVAYQEYFAGKFIITL